ncbi:hypothetical protein H5410_053005 [Solanum commersonii]|uniref:Uncharacterized protein n=1 Tax=Solanum commersonii TaxID=4109 RepID=A0A9J5X351_SOLCO|nr:hypothetical protein H5410_053005 [Solanum commersonii]
MYVKTLAIDSVGPDGPNDPFSRSNDPQSSQLSLTSKTAYFQGQTNPEVGKHSILVIFICYSLLIIGDPNFDVILAEIFHGHPLRH